jgi:Peptidase family S41
MSEKMYTRLFRLYPSSFRKQYEGEALQLVRDRLRDETGFFKRARLVWDLVSDVLAGLPQAYRNSYAVTEEASASPNAEGIPSFKVLDEEPLGRGSILIGGTLSLATIGAFGFLLSRPMAYMSLSGSNGRISPIESVVERLNRATTPDRTVGGAEEVAKSTSAGAREQLPRSWPAAATSTLVSEAPALRSESENDVNEQDQVVSIRTLNANNGSPRLRIVPGPSGALPEASEMTSVHGDIVAPVAKDASLDAAERRRVITGAINNLRQHYFDREVAQETAGALLAHEKNGDDDAAKDGVVFADLLTRQMRDASHDMHLVMEYSREILPEQPPEPTPESLARYRKAMEQQNCMFRKIEILSHNIGYLKVDFFPDTSVCQSTATAAMAALNHAAAIIFDLRDNAGGFPGMVTLIAGYLFDHPEYMYGPRGAPTEEFWTRSPIPGNTLADKPVYVLTSAATWSGAEQFSYDLKMLKRATLVGETTRGGAHAGAFHRIDDHFGMGIPEEKAINPFGKADWEGVGVEPDVKVRAAEALETAMKLAEASVGTK